MQKRVEYLLDHEEIRGATPRYWEDVKAGDELPTLVKGPLSVGEMWAGARRWAAAVRCTHLKCAACANTRPGAGKIRRPGQGDD